MGKKRLYLSVIGAALVVLGVWLSVLRTGQRPASRPQISQEHTIDQAAPNTEDPSAALASTGVFAALEKAEPPTSTPAAENKEPLVFGPAPGPDVEEYVDPGPTLSDEVLAALRDEYEESTETNRGEKLVRREAELLIKANPQLAEEQATRENISLEEVTELTFLGLAALRLQNPARLREVIGRDLSQEEQKAIDDLMRDADARMKRAIRQHVEQGNPTEVRWETINSVRDDYFRSFKELFELSDQEFDSLLFDAKSLKP